MLKYLIPKEKSCYHFSYICFYTYFHYILAEWAGSDRLVLFKPNTASCAVTHSVTTVTLAALPGGATVTEALAI